MCFNSKAELINSASKPREKLREKITGMTAAEGAFLVTLAVPVIHPSRIRRKARAIIEQ